MLVTLVLTIRISSIERLRIKLVGDLVFRTNTPSVPRGLRVGRPVRSTVLMLDTGYFKLGKEYVEAGYSPENEQHTRSK